MLRTLVSLQRPVRTENSVFGDGAVASHTTFASVWADCRPVSGNELSREDVHVAESAWKIRIRHRTDVTPGCRVSWGGRVVNLTRVEDPIEGRNQETHLYGVEQENPEVGS